ncbi:MAG: hypothetical protein ACFB10_16400 [Salibacteraceae bacterium]
MPNSKRILAVAAICVATSLFVSCTKEDTASQFTKSQIVTASPANVPSIHAKDQDKTIAIQFESGFRPYGVREYRVVLVKSVLSLSFNSTKAKELGDGCFLKVRSGQGSYQVPINTIVFDNEGDPVRPGIEYKAFVFSVPDDNLTNTGALSAPSYEFSIPRT